ncbi:hypothetical protein B0T21DRAFT_352044 [Apiosordaria backusii]|uniref:Extracellular membrane protein CFEM domain-containing protein n=1 Tax=Apiosordaria backusii TaxID=314023 RepID=A0AA40DWX1_9PEZI|nr:hypothetical protein B0T21DRAFT_352044 [Apiosordaria backusii]
MARLLYLTSLLAATASAINPLFIGSSPQCQSCFDNAVATCPGDPATQSFAECMCGGAGSELFVGTCIPTCTQTTGHTYDLYAISLYTYCIMFFPQFCEPAKELGVTEKLWEDSCGKEALASKSAAAEGGNGNSGGPTVGTDLPTQTGGGSDNAAQTTQAPSGTNAPGSNNAQGGAGPATTTKAGAPGMNGVSVAAVMLGLGAVFVGVAL